VGTALAALESDAEQVAAAVQSLSPARRRRMRTRDPASAALPVS
jgi:hypothetical protein